MSEQEDFLRPLIREILQEVLETEMDEALGAEKGERTSNRRGYRSGYYGRTLVTRVGKPELRVPQDRQGHFRAEVFERYQRSEKALVGAMTEMYVQGGSTREHSQGVTHVLARALSLAGMDAARLAFLVDECAHWPPPSRDRLIAQLDLFIATAAADADRAKVWAALRDLVNNHRAHATADWAMPADALVPLAAVRDRLVPADVIVRYSWLFDDWWPALGEPRGDDHAATDAAIEQARKQAINAVLQAKGQDGLVDLARAVKYPGFVARDAAGMVLVLDAQRALLMTTLVSDNPSDRLLGRALVFRWHELAGEAWVDTILTAPLTDDPSRVGALLLGLPFGRAVWHRSGAFGADIEREYWRQCPAWLPQGASLDDLTYAVEHLMENKRAFDALELIGLHLGLAPGELLVRALDRSESRSLPARHYLHDRTSGTTSNGCSNDSMPEARSNLRLRGWSSPFSHS